MGFLTGPAWGVGLEGEVEGGGLVGLVCGEVDVDHWVVVEVGLLAVNGFVIRSVVVVGMPTNITHGGLADTISGEEDVDGAVLPGSVIPFRSRIFSRG